MAAMGDKQLQRKCIIELDPAEPPGQSETDEGRRVWSFDS